MCSGCVPRVLIVAVHRCTLVFVLRLREPCSTRFVVFCVPRQELCTMFVFCVHCRVPCVFIAVVRMCFVLQSCSLECVLRYNRVAQNCVPALCCTHRNVFLPRLAPPKQSCYRQICLWGIFATCDLPCRATPTAIGLWVA